MIKQPNPDEIDEIVDLHQKSLKEGLLYRLGTGVLKIFYSEIFNDKTCFILANYTKDKITGVAASSEDSEKFFKSVEKSHFFCIAFNVLLKSIREPALPLNILFSKQYNIKPELMFLFVDENYRGKKIGERLVNAVSKEFKKRNIKKWHITILSANTRGKKFYERLGFEKIGQYQFLGEKRDVYEYVTKFN